MTMASSETMVRTYKTAQEFNMDSATLATQGWRIANVIEQQHSPGCARILFLGLWSLIFKPKPTLLVTYVRERQGLAP